MGNRGASNPSSPIALPCGVPRWSDTWGLVRRVGVWGAGRRVLGWDDAWGRMTIRMLGSALDARWGGGRFSFAMEWAEHHPA